MDHRPDDATPVPHTPGGIVLAGVTKSFRDTRGGTVEAVRGLDLTIAPGEIVAILGHNGAGKTTTLDMILGLTVPTSGSVTVGGARPREAVEHGRVGAVLQTGGLLADLSVRETVRLIASVYPDPTPVADVLARAGLTDLADRRVSKCSGGEQQRLRFALALLPDPDLLVLDEPTAGLDVAARHEFWDTMRDESNSGRTVLFATHYLAEADSFADRIVMLSRGAVVADDTTAAIRARFGGRTVSAVVPESEREAARDALDRRADVTSVARRGDRLLVQGSDTDAVALTLLTRWDAHDLEITTPDLESAYLALTDSEGVATEAAR